MAPSERSTLDVVAIVISLIALVASFASPFVVYHWLQNDVRVQQLKATALIVTPSGMSGITPIGDEIKIERTNTIHVENKGSLPVGDVEVILIHDDDNDFFNSVEIIVVPPLAFKKDLTNGRLSIAFEKPIPPKQVVDIDIVKTEQGKDLDASFNYRKVQCWIRSEAMPTIPVLVQ